MNFLNKYTLFLFSFIGSIGSLFGQTSVTFGYTGGTQTYTVPPCVSSITLTVAGADGGGPAGGNGAVITYNLPVNPGDVITMNVGGTGVAGGVGYGGGGTGFVSNDNNANYASYGGGGATTVSVNGVPVIISGGGGGSGGGSNNVAGGGGGCATGVTGASTFGLGGGAGTQVSGGAGGVPWAATPPGGQAGSLGQGGNGGIWGTASGGGGGGGYYGGGGGGNDGCCTGANGGGGGGGGSSLVPAGAGCVQASNNGAGYITMGASPGISASNTGPYCAGSTIQLNATAGATSYAWTGPNGFTSNVQNPTIPASTVSMSGTYSVIGTGTGCSTPSTTNVVVVAPPTPNAGADSVLCLGSAIHLNGVLSTSTDTHAWTHNTTGVTPTPTVTYAPNAGNITPTVTVNQAGTYLFILSENNGVCPAVYDTVQMIVSVTSHTTSFTQPSCAGMSDGTITITNANGVNYSYDGGTNWVPNSTQGGFPIGTYSVVSQNQYGCTFTSSVTVTQPPALLAYGGNDTLVCQNGTANMWASTSQPALPIIYHWSHDPGTAATSTISPLANTTVEVYGEGPSGCLSDTVSIQINVRPAISGNITAFDTICPGYPTTIGVFGIADGIGMPYDIVWSTGETGIGDFMDIQVNPPVTTTYTATITDACESSPLILTTQVYVAPLPVPTMSIVDDGICEPAVFELHLETDPAMVQNFVWILSDGQIAYDESPFFTDSMMHNTYDVQLIVTSPLGCIDSITNYNYMTSFQLPVAHFTWSPNPVKMFNTELSFSNQTFLGDQYYWTFEQGVPAYSSVERPKIQFPDGVTGSYEVVLYVVSEEGCMDTITRIITVLPEVLIYAPNSFTPDGDEFNQTWKPSIEGIDDFSYVCQIFNRWGELIWESNDLNVGWDGTYNGKVMQPGMYTWKITARDAVSDGKYFWNGTVNILK